MNEVVEEGEEKETDRTYEQHLITLSKSKTRNKKLNKNKKN